MSDGGLNNGTRPESVKDKNLRAYLDEALDALLSGEVATKDELLRFKIHLCREHSLPQIPRDSEILARARARLSPDELEKVAGLLRKKPLRTASGIAAVAVMTSPEECPHGTCAYCPGGPHKGTAQSYTGQEPASLRASSHDFDPYRQVRARVGQLDAIGHPTDKVELIVMGGTFTARTPEYQDEFLEGCFRGLNESGGWGADAASAPDGGGGGPSAPPPAESNGGMESNVSPTLTEAHRLNESALHRCIGMTIETRPDRCGVPEVDRILAQGGTRVELGVQTLHDDILEGVKRGHGSAETARATALMKDAGLKVGYHMMPFLPGADEDMELASFHRAFGDTDFKPDLLKIYPTLVVEGTPLYDLWKSGEYSPPDTDRAARLLASVKSGVPEWVRISRIQRDIPLKCIAAGVEMSNLRQVVAKVMVEGGQTCRCIRCREVAHKVGLDTVPSAGDVEMRRVDYEASGGKEAFISHVLPGPDALVAFVRLRLPSPEAHRPELAGGGVSVIRELKVFGPMAPLEGGSAGRGRGGTAAGGAGGSAAEAWQHLGLGERLVDEAKRVSRDEWGAHWMLVTSGVGARPYYARLGFRRVGPYMGIGLD